MGLRFVTILVAAALLLCAGCGAWLGDIAQQWFPSKGGGDGTEHQEQQP